MSIPRHLPTAIVITAWLMFVVSFFLPATNVLAIAGTMPGTPLTGWQTFTTALQMMCYPLTLLLIPHYPQILLLLTFPFINLTMLLIPIAVLNWDESWILSAFFLPAGLLPWFLPKEFTGDLFIGFYLWDFSFFMMMVGGILASLRRNQIYER